MASGLGGGASTGAAAASSSQAVSHSNARGGGRQQDTFAGLLAGAAPTADTAAAANPAGSTFPPSDTSPEEAVNDDALPEQILNLIGGAWPPTTPPPVGESHLPGDVIGDLSTTGELPITALLIEGTEPVADGSDMAPTALVPGKAGTLPASAAATAGLALPLAQAGATDGTDASGDFSQALGQAIGTDTATKSPAVDAEGADPVEFILPGQQTMASSPARGPAPVLVGAAVAMPADPDAGFDDSFGARIGWMAEQRIGHAQIRVSPDHVGPIDVRLQLDGTRVSAEFVSANADVRHALEASVGRLRDLLDQQGLQLTHSDVGSGQSDTSGERAASDSSDTPGFGDGDGNINHLPEPVLMRRGLLDEYA